MFGLGTDEQRGNEDLLSITTSFGLAAATDNSEFTVTWTTTANELKRLISERYNLPLALLRITCNRSLHVLRGNDALGVYELEGQLVQGDHLNCIRLPVPTDFDIVGECDMCEDVRHLFFAYARQGYGADYEPVAGYCQACGGKPFDPCSSEIANTNNSDP